MGIPVSAMGSKYIKALDGGMLKDGYATYFIIMVTISDRNSVRNERFTSAHGFRGISPLLQGRCAENSSVHGNRREWLSCLYHGGTIKQRAPARVRGGF